MDSDPPEGLATQKQISSISRWNNVRNAVSGPVTEKNKPDSILDLFF